MVIMAVSMKASAIQPMEAQFKLEILKNIKVPSRKSQKELVAVNSSSCHFQQKVVAVNRREKLVILQFALTSMMICLTKNK